MCKVARRHGLKAMPPEETMPVPGYQSAVSPERALFPEGRHGLQSVQIR